MLSWSPTTELKTFELYNNKNLLSFPHRDPKQVCSARCIGHHIKSEKNINFVDKINYGL